MTHSALLPRLGSPFAVPVRRSAPQNEYSFGTSSSSAQRCIITIDDTGALSYDRAFSKHVLIRCSSRLIANKKGAITYVTEALHATICDTGIKLGDEFTVDRLAPMLLSFSDKDSSNGTMISISKLLTAAMLSNRQKVYSTPAKKLMKRLHDSDIFIPHAELFTRHLQTTSTSSSSSSSIPSGTDDPIDVTYPPSPSSSSSSSVTGQRKRKAAKLKPPIQVWKAQSGNFYRTGSSSNERNVVAMKFSGSNIKFQHPTLGNTVLFETEAAAPPTIKRDNPHNRVSDCISRFCSSVLPINEVSTKALTFTFEDAPKNPHFYSTQGERSGICNFFINQEDSLNFFGLLAKYSTSHCQDALSSLMNRLVHPVTVDTLSKPEWKELTKRLLGNKKDRIIRFDKNIQEAKLLKNKAAEASDDSSEESEVDFDNPDHFKRQPPAEDPFTV